VVISYASELQTVVNEPIYNGNSYFISASDMFGVFYVISMHAAVVICIWF